jgi:hypothetical protein
MEVDFLLHLRGLLLSIRNNIKEGGQAVQLEQELPIPININNNQVAIHNNTVSSSLINSNGALEPRIKLVGIQIVTMAMINLGEAVVSIGGKTLEIK